MNIFEMVSNAFQEMRKRPRESALDSRAKTLYVERAASLSATKEARMALSIRKREPRQAGNGATVARKGVAGPLLI